ncbi:hypothetical protein [Clostridium beijerinckii]|uniref:hypothetical protein n=1 Tax=Clostridium beijerinckii TaxID=1520 RepID=UPI00098C427A|nr:hypothetical protein [Clostridium beijerinckii]NRT78131.1 hypothetical protein [Clostridium beijerinckii]OOM44789.1 hypothetical protein CBEIJ_35350 [Clostridium beijerinckii]
MDKVVKLPIAYSIRKKNEMGKGYVPCQISSRYLKLHGVSEVGDKNFIMLDVMTENDNHEHKKICEMAIALEDLREAIKEVSEN